MYGLFRSRPGRPLTYAVVCTTLGGELSDHDSVQAAELPHRWRVDDRPGTRRGPGHVGDEGSGDLPRARCDRFRFRAGETAARRRGSGRGRPRRTARLGRRSGPPGVTGSRRTRGRGRPRQPGRDGARLGPGNRTAAHRRDRLAGPARRLDLHRTRLVRRRVDRSHRAAARPVLRRPEDGLDPPGTHPRGRRHHQRLLARPPADRRVRHRRGHSGPHPTARPRPGRPGRPGPWKSSASATRHCPTSSTATARSARRPPSAANSR